MANKDWDDREYWEDDSRCLVCKENMGKTEALICSATCEDIWGRLSGARQLPDIDQESVRWEGWERENDCYA